MRRLYKVFVVFQDQLDLAVGERPFAYERDDTLRYRYLGWQVDEKFYEIECKDRPWIACSGPFEALKNQYLLREQREARGRTNFYYIFRL